MSSILEHMLTSARGRKKSGGKPGGGLAVVIEAHGRRPADGSPGHKGKGPMDAMPGEHKPAPGEGMGGGQEIEQKAYDNALESLQVLAEHKPEFGKVLDQLQSTWTAAMSGAAKGAMGGGPEGGSPDGSAGGGGGTPADGGGDNEPDPMDESEGAEGEMGLPKG